MDNSMWSRVLDLMQGRMTKATFDNLLKDTTGEITENTLTVQAKNEHAIEWLENRHRPTIEHIVATVTGHEGTQIRYEISEAPKPEPRPQQPESAEFSVEIVSFDPTHWGEIITQRYALVFWQPLLGWPFQVWLTLRTFAWNEEEGWPPIQLLADICANSNRHRLTGRNERIDRTLQIGALEVLARAKVIHIRTSGFGRRIQYYFRVLDKLPLLTPHQVEELTPALQERHEKWLWKCSIDYEEWQQLNFNSLLED